MKIVEHYYSADLDWAENFAQQFGGMVDGGFIKIPDDIQRGTRYLIECEEGITAYYIDVEYQTDLLLVQKNIRTDFVGVYYNLTEGDAEVAFPGSRHKVSRRHYNLSVIDGSLESEYKVKKGSKTFALIILIKKSIIEAFFAKHSIGAPELDKLMDPKHNAIVRFDRMSDSSFHLLDELRKIKVGNAIFDLNLAGTVHMLIADLLKKTAVKKFATHTVHEQDLSAIVSVQLYLMENIDREFPSIGLLAAKAKMSESKFKKMFAKIIGNTPNVFFTENKLIRAKELLETKRYTVSEIVCRLHFCNSSYFCAKFKEYFQVSPRVFVKDL